MPLPGYKYLNNFHTQEALTV